MPAPLTIVSDQPTPSIANKEEFTALLDKEFGKGKWHFGDADGGYRTKQRENEIREEGAQTVPKGETSRHSMGTVDSPGAYDVIVPGLNPRQVQRRLQDTGADFLHFYPEENRATQGAHLHVSVPIGEAPQPQPKGAPAGGLTIVSSEPTQPEKPAAPKAKPQPSVLHPLAEALRDFPREANKQRIEADTNLARRNAADEAIARERMKKGQPISTLADLPRQLGDLGAVAERVFSPVEAFGTSLVREVENFTGLHQVDPRTVADVAQLAIPFAGDVKAGLAAGKLAEEAGVGTNYARKILERQKIEAAKAPGPIAKAANVAAAPGKAVAYVAKPAAKALVNFVQKVGGTQNVNEEALRRVVSRLNADAASGGPTAQDMLDIRNRLPNKPLTVMDVAGPNTLSYAGRMARQPGESKAVLENFLKTRDDKAFARIRGDIEKYISKGGPAYKSKEALVETRKAAAAPFYDAAYKKYPVNPDIVAPKGAIGQLMTRPSYRRGMANALKIAAEEGVDPNSLGITLDQAGEPRFAKVPTWKTLDYVKRGMDDVVESYRDKTTGKLVLDTYGRAADATRTQYRNTLKALNPDYARALNAYSGPSETIEAIQRGQNLFNTRPEQIKSFMKDMSDSDKEFFRLGAADALLLKLSKTSLGGDEAKRLIGNQYLKEQIGALFPQQKQAEKFIDSIASEMDMFATKQAILGGSQTAGRVAEDISNHELTANKATGAVFDAATGRFASAARKGAEALRSFGERNDPQINAEAARLLTQPLPNNALSALAREQRSPVAKNYLLAAKRRLDSHNARRAITSAAGATDLGEQK